MGIGSHNKAGVVFMQGLEKEYVQELLDAYHDDLIGAVMAAWGRWERFTEEDRKDLAFHPGRRANVLNSFILAEGRRRFRDTSVIIHETVGTTTFLFEEQVLARFKKLDRDGGSRNYPTARALDWNLQQDLPGIPGLGRVDVGYVLNEQETGLERILVAHPLGEQITWTYPIWDVDDATRAIHLLADPTPGAPSQGSQSGVRIKHRDDDGMKKERQARD